VRKISKVYSEENLRNTPDFSMHLSAGWSHSFSMGKPFGKFETKAREFPDLFLMGKHCLFPADKGAETYGKFPKLSLHLNLELFSENLERKNHVFYKFPSGIQESC
jgi:hypothetical protein